MRSKSNLTPWIMALVIGGLSIYALSKPSQPRTREELDREVRKAIRKYSAMYGVPAKYLYGIAMTESSILPKWAFSYHPDGRSFGIYGLTSVALRDIGMSMDQIKNSVDAQTKASAKYLKRLYRALGDWNKAIQAYHIGIGNVRRGRTATRYLNKVLRYARRW